MYAEKPQTADKGTEHEKDKKHHYKEENRVTNFHPIFCISLCFFVRNEPRLTVLIGAPTKMYFCGVIYSSRLGSSRGVPVANEVSNGVV